MYALYHGDCLDILPTLPAQSVDAIIADPPYGKTACKWDSVIPLDAMWRELKRVIKPRGAVVLFGAQPFTSALVMSNAEWFRYEWVWDKKRSTGGALVQYMPMRAHENLLVFSKERHTYNPQMNEWTPAQVSRMAKTDFLVTNISEVQYRAYIRPGRQRKVENGKHPQSVIKIDGLASLSPERTGHPTQKPVELLRYLIRTYTNPGETVLDFCFGSCTTGVAAIMEGRNFVGMEKEADYYALGARRMEQVQPALMEAAD